MNKTLLKRILFELIEDLIHLDFQIQAVEQSALPHTLGYTRTLRKQLEAVSESLWAKKEALNKLFEEASLEDSFVDYCLTELFPQIRQGLSPLVKALYRLKKGFVPPETGLYLSSLNLGRLLPDAPPLVVLPALDQNDKDEGLAESAVMLSYLPTVSMNNPLNLVGLLDVFFDRFCNTTLQVSSMLEKLPVPDPKTAVIAPALNLRLLGPGYYAYYVLQAFQNRDVNALWFVEPILFQELNRFGLVNKDLVILHQSVERAKTHASLGQPADWSRTLDPEVLGDEILKVVERVIPDRLAFTEKSLLRSQLLEERLAQGMLISAVPMLSSPAQLRDELNSLSGDDGIYRLLSQMQETPATPLEIINAAWLYKLDQSFGWMAEAFEASDVQTAWDLLVQVIRERDTIVQKSIEISEVHRVLAREDAETLVPA